MQRAVGLFMKVFTLILKTICLPGTRIANANTTFQVLMSNVIKVGILCGSHKKGHFAKS